MSTRGLFDTLAAQRRFIYLSVALISAAGLWAALHLASAIYPELTFDRITVVAEGSALSARQVVFSATRPLEEAVSVVPGVIKVRSRSIRGSVEMNITFAPHTDMQLALQQVQARVNAVRGDLPPEMDVEVERLTPSLFPVLSYNLEGGDPAVLYDLARYQLAPVIARVPGVGRVNVQGSDVHEIEVVADPARLAGVGLTYDSLASAIRASSTVSAVGRMTQDYRQYLVVSAQEAHSADDVANIVIGHGLRVRDVAAVSLGTKDKVSIVAGDGHPAALLNITRQLGGNTVAISDSVAALAVTMRKALPPGVILKPVYDQAALVRDAVKSVRDAMIIGALLAVIILLLFLRHGKITAISASAIPLTMAITVWLMSLIGQTFNLMTLGAMAIAIGLVIDDAVVVTENIARHLRLTPDRNVAVREAMKELIWPVTTSTVTTVVVFLPLRLLTGVVGQFFAALSITLTIAVLVSLVLAVTIIPLLSSQYLDAHDAEGAEEESPGAWSRSLNWVTHRIDSLSDRYERSLSSVLHHGRRLAIAAAVLIVAGIITLRFVPTGFLPEIDEGAFVLDYLTSGGTALTETDRQVHKAEEILLKTPEVTGISRRTGAELGLFATAQNVGDIAVRLKPEGKRSRDVFAVIDDVRQQIETTIPTLHIEFVQILSDVINDLAGAARPVEIKLFGTDLNALETYAEKLAPKLEGVNGVEDLYNGVSEPSPELSMHVDLGEVNRLGLSPLDVSDAVRGALLGADAGQVRLGDRPIDVRVRAPDSVRYNAQRIASLPLAAGQNGAPVPLAALARFEETTTRADLLRENQQQMIAMTGDVSGRSLGAIMTDVRAVLAQNPPPPGVRMEIGGQYASQQESFHALLIVLGLAACSVVAVMVLQFQSFVEPLVILLAAPLSFVGAMLLLLITNTPLNVSSFMGLILLVGLIVKNGIILLDFTRRRMLESDLPLEQAMLEAAHVRLRPILMTTLCTLFGLLPLALGLGAGSRMQQPLALAVIGGLALSTPITLYVVPTLLISVRGRGWKLPRVQQEQMAGV